MVAIIEKRDLKDFDWLTTLLALSIAAFGVWQIHNATPTEGYWTKQIFGIVIAFVAFLVVAFTDYRRAYRFGSGILCDRVGTAFAGVDAAWCAGQWPKSLGSASSGRAVSAI